MMQRITDDTLSRMGLASSASDETTQSVLTFLDDRLLGATSNAVERANRRYRKMQKSVYRVRTYAHVVARIALDLFREAAMRSRSAALNFLHAERAGPLIPR